LGSSNVITDQDGNLRTRYEYQPYGSISLNETTDPGLPTTDYYFTGKELDDNGLYYYGARYYDPEIGRFISADPTIQHPNDPQDFNRYAYCRNNPLKYIDPTGYGWWSSFWKGLVSGLAGGLVFGLIVGLSGGTLTPLALIAGGAVSGAVRGGIDGGWQGALQGGIMGGLMGGAFAINPIFGGVVLAGSLGYGGYSAYKNGGWQGVGEFAAGVAGGIIGFAAGAGAGYGIGNSIRANNQAKVNYKYTKIKRSLETDSRSKIDPSNVNKNYIYDIEGKIKGPNIRCGFKYPTNRGFLGDPQEITLKPGMLIDRYGPPSGEFLSPKGTPFSARSLPVEYFSRQLHTYKVIRPFKVYGGEIAPNYGQEGLGIQFDLGSGRSVQSLIDKGYLVEVP